jgi:glycolate oxidase FAD binding subunit
MSIPTLAAFADEFTPATQPELARFMAENATTRQRVLYPVGGRTALHYGFPASDSGIAVSTSKLTHVIDYPARDMTITVEAGIRIEALAELLKQEGQRLPIDVPQSHRATLGGIIACNTSGARRLGLGTLRDYVIGTSAIDAAGALFKSGGRVVKNVAGYDICKVLVGSLGTLGVITQVTLKLRPIPESTRWLWAGFSRFDQIEPVLQRLLLSATRPIAIEVLDPSAATEISAEARTALPTDGPILGLAFEGSSRETGWQIDTVKSELQPFQPHHIVETPEADSPSLLNALTEFEITAEEPLTFKANLVPSQTVEFLNQAAKLGVSVQSHVGSGIVIGHLPDTITSVQSAQKVLTPLKAFASQHQGNLIVVNCSEDWKSPLAAFGDREPSWHLMQRLKQQLDPQDLLNRGRFIFPATSKPLNVA